ncbi:MULTISPECIES: DNA polymerase IV [unclassified Methylophaga]|jgi:DNA polymerase-4|uniref:DNA polymerase IV n=1 Tax=unclassified Methylophaga TaxID=2629249 RepID=UPI000C499573|nr:MULTISPECIES: DNA polymerase IV [unclassified Methylophaga]MAL48637.1 DNA polymerase IV [Methylophaga sp.]MBP26294.1 DNA polymerase IV [Methylophaga sp.]HCC80293.1 DNA polymerase IV [Methylophaga sp.]|tara:strand:- start:508 stop:1605 length:1098 start_codon:yes stop_codon:yes gene_type:complete
MAKQRKIIHVDMDAFYASVEQRDFPELKGKPLIVGGQPDSRGVVAACSYEARKFGIHSAMASSRAYRLCPEAIFVRPRFDAYKEVSNQIREIFWRYASEVEPLSLDEAYLDVTYTESFNGSATLIAKAIKAEILAETGLTASAGVSYNKFLAKIASDMDKPDGLYLIRPEQGQEFVNKLPVGKFHGIGPATEAKMKNLGIHTGNDLRQKSLAELTERFGKSGQYYYNIARAIDERPVRSSRIRKSLGKETTFAEDILSVPELTNILLGLAEQVLESLNKHDMQGRTVTVKVKYADFQQVTRAQTLDRSIGLAELQEWIPKLLARTEAGNKPVRLVGLSLSGFELPVVDEKGQAQLDLLLNSENMR